MVIGCRKHWRGSQDFVLVLVGLLFLVLSTRSIRHSTSAAPLLTRPWRTQPGFRPRGRGKQLRLALMTLGVASTVVGLGLAWREMANKLPLGPAIIAGVERCPGPLFNSYDDGGALLWFVPERAVFVDSRQDPYPAELLLQTHDAIAHGTYQALFQKYHIACALVPAGKPLQAALQQDGWHILVRDASYVVLRAP